MQDFIVQLALKTCRDILSHLIRPEHDLVPDGFLTHRFVEVGEGCRICAWAATEGRGASHYRTLITQHLQRLNEDDPFVVQVAAFLEGIRKKSLWRDDPQTAQLALLKFAEDLFQSLFDGKQDLVDLLETDLKQLMPSPFVTYLQLLPAYV